MEKRNKSSSKDGEVLIDIEQSAPFPSTPNSSSRRRSPTEIVPPTSNGGNINNNSSDQPLPEPSCIPGISSIGLKVLLLLAVQNSSKNLLMRYVMKEKPQFLTSAAVIGSECCKFTLSTMYILFVEKKSIGSIIQFFKEDFRNTILVAVPASAYNLQMTLEYIALANLDAANFSVLVQTKLLFTATFAAVLLRKKLKYIQVISLALLTVGVMLCNMKFNSPTNNNDNNSDNNDTTMDDIASDKRTTRGILATLGIAVSSGFASVYTEKVIKTQRAISSVQGKYSLAYTQVQLASMSLLTIGIYACIMDFSKIVKHGLFHNFNFGAAFTVVNSAIGGLIVAGVLKYADSVLKGYATAMSVIMTGLLSMVLFGTELHVVYFLGIVNVVAAVLLYNGKDLDQYICS